MWAALLGQGMARKNAGGQQGGQMGGNAIQRAVGKVLGMFLPQQQAPSPQQTWQPPQAPPYQAVPDPSQMVQTTGAVQVPRTQNQNAIPWHWWFTGGGNRRVG